MITFVPRRGALLMCNLGPDPASASTFPLLKPPVSMSPEMWKIRQVVVVSPASRNHRHARGPGVCLVVPFSASHPASPGDHDVFFKAGSYRSLTRASWAKCASVMDVSHGRLDRPLSGRGYISEYLTADDMARVEAGLRAALGL